MSNNKLLIERLNHNQSNLVSVESEQGKDWYLKGLFIQGEVRNQNGRIYPTREIKRAVGEISNKLNSGYSILGEADHPDTLSINIDRVSHMIESMWMEGNDGMGKLKIIPATPMGQIIKALIESDVKLGVSSRGCGDLDSDSKVSNFEIVTVDIVANPSAPNAYPKPIYESLLNMTGGHKILEMGHYATVEDRAKKALSNEIIRLIKDIDKT